eukprot:scaffold65023_cov34-Phaeocystis_antarctica.AAC.1
MAVAAREDRATAASERCSRASRPRLPWPPAKASRRGWRRGRMPRTAPVAARRGWAARTALVAAR